MSYLFFLIIIVGAIVAVAMLITRGTRRRDGDTPSAARTGTERGETEIPPYPGRDRPAGPGAEGMNPATPGDSSPAPGDTTPARASDEAALPSEGSSRNRPGEPGQGQG